MSNPKIDYLCTGVAVAFDVDTGAVLHIHEKLVETVDGKLEKQSKVSSAECEEIRQQIAIENEGCKVDAVIAPEGMVPQVGKRFRVDPMTKVVFQENEKQ